VRRSRCSTSRTSSTRLVRRPADLLLGRDVPAAIDPTSNAADLNVGTAILKHFVITTDFPRHALWLEARR
jgi:hypothetical protein